MKPNSIPLALFALTISFFSCSDESKKIQPTRQDITLSVYASAKVLPANHYTAFSQYTAVIDEIRIQAGDTVQLGDTLVLFKAQRQKLEKENADLNQSLAKENFIGSGSEIAQLQNEINALQTQFDIDSTNYQRQLRLWENNIGSQSQLESRHVAYTHTKSRLSTAEDRLAQMKVRLRNQYRQSINKSQLVEIGVQDFIVFSKLPNARVYDIYKEEGELILPQEPLLLVGSRDSFQIELEVDEVDIAQIEKGQKVILALDAIPDSTFTCEITRIEPNKNERTQTFTVRAEFVELPAKLFSGISGEANIIIRTKQNALTVPAEYITSDNKVITNEGEVEITMGDRNLDRVEILSGIDENTELTLPE